MAVVRALGWTHAERGDVEPPWLHRTMRHPGASLPQVELHWRIHWYETQFAALLERARVIDGLRRLDRIDQLAALLLFYARDGFTGLRLPADIAAWWDRHGSPAVPAGLQRLMAQHPALAEPWRAALAAALRVAGLPGEVALPGCLPQARRSEFAVRLTNWDVHGETDQIRANVGLIDGLLAPRGGLPDYLGRQLFPPLGALSRVYPIVLQLPPPRRRLPRAACREDAGSLRAGAVAASRRAVMESACRRPMTSGGTLAHATVCLPARTMLVGSRRSPRLHTDDLRKTMGQRARAFAEREWNYCRFCSTLVRVVEEAIIRTMIRAVGLPRALSPPPT